MQQALIGLEQRLTPCNPVRIVDLISRLFLHWKGKADDNDSEMIFEDWAEDLEGYSEAHIREICSWWRKNENRPPKIAQFSEMLESKAIMDRTHKRRARVLLGMEQPLSFEYPIREDGKPLTAEGLAELQKKIDELPPALADQVRKMLVDVPTKTGA